MSVEVWTSPAFLDEVRDWVMKQLVRHGVTLTGEWAQPHARVWSSAIRFETTDGRVWFKVNGSGTRHEAALVRLLAELVPGLLPEVLAVDPDRGWSLSRDGGPMLREVVDPQDSWAPWQGVLGRYAEAQLLLAGEQEAVLGAGVPEVSPGTVPGQARLLIEELARVPVVDGGLTAEQADLLSEVLPRLDEWCAELDSSPVPDSVQHDDRHSGNVCWTGSVATARVIDWGDASWGCPLSTMLSTVSSVRHFAGLEADQRILPPDVARLRDAYLEPFTTYAARADLVHLCDLAARTGRVGKAMSWRAGLVDAPRSLQAELEFPVREWLLDLLEEPPGY